MEHPSHTTVHLTKGSNAIKTQEKHREIAFKRVYGLDEEAAKKKAKLSSAQQKFLKKIRARKRRHFNKEEIPAI